MPIMAILSTFKATLAQCDSLVASAHRIDQQGQSHFSTLDRQQITVAAFLNMFMAWEMFLEDTISNLMAGAATLTGVRPTKYISPASPNDAKEMIRGTQRYFDYASHEHVRKLVRLYFDNGYPFEPHLSGIISDLSDLRTMRNASAHISSTTQTALESLAQRIFGAPKPGISLYQLLTSSDPRSSIQETFFLSYRNKLIVTAELIANG